MKKELLNYKYLKNAVNCRIIYLKIIIQKHKNCLDLKHLSEMIINFFYFKTAL